MKTIALLITYCTLPIAHCFSQGNIDVENDIRMGITGTEHVKITSDHFSVHPSVSGTPLIFGRFSDGFVGIGNADPMTSLNIVTDASPVLRMTAPSGQTDVKVQFLENNNTTPQYGFEIGYNPVPNQFEINSYNNNVTPTNVLTITRSNGNVGINTSTPSQKLDVNGSVNVSGTVVASGSTINGSQTVAGNSDVAGDVSFRNTVHTYAREVGVAGGGYYDFIFSTDFSAGMTIEVTTTGIIGSSASTMNTEKHAFQFYMYSNSMSYQYNKITLYQMGEETGYLDTNIYAVGSGNQFRVRVSNSHSNTYSASVYIHVVKRATPSLVPLF